MNLHIARLVVTLQDVSPDLGRRVAALLGQALEDRLSRLEPDRGGIAGGGPSDLPRDIAHVDLGFIEADTRADAQVLSQLIAAQLAGWIDKEGQ